MTWIAPTQNTDGSPITGLAGYKVRYGQSAAELGQTVNLADPAATSVRIEGLEAGTWYFTLSAYSNTGAESEQVGPFAKVI